MDTMQMGAAGVAIEREINAKLRAEIDRLCAANAELLAACEAVRRTFEASDNAATGAETLDLVDAAIASTRAAGKGE